MQPPRGLRRRRPIPLPAGAAARGLAAAAVAAALAAAAARAARHTGAAPRGLAAAAVAAALAAAAGAARHTGAAPVPPTPTLPPKLAPLTPVPTATKPPAPTPTPVPEKTPAPDWVRFLPPNHQDLPPAKRALEERMAQEQARGLRVTPPPRGAPPSAYPTNDTKPTGGRPVPFPRRAAGAGTIVDTGGAVLVRDIDFFHENLWYVDKEGATLIVYAGPAKDDPLQGMVAVRVTDPKLGLGGHYRTPVRAGGVRVVDAVGERVILQAADGTRFAFDVPTRQFVAP